VTLAPPIFCLVTDRRQLARRVGCDPDSGDAFDAVIAQVRAAAGAGVGLVHLRDPDLAPARLVDLARAMRQALAPFDARLVVNDRLDVVLASHADGVHLKATSIADRDARQLLGESRLIGRSLHAAAGIGETEHSDYVVFGTVFPSASKPDGWAAAGPIALAEVVRAAGRRPVLAIGGVTIDTAAEARRRGASGLAAIGAFLPVAGAPLAESVQTRARALRIAFDSTTPLS